MDILAMVDLYYMAIVMILSFLINGKIKEWGFSINKQTIVLAVALVSGAAFILVDYFLGVEDLSQSYKKLILTFLVSTAFYDFIIKLVIKQFK